VKSSNKVSNVRSQKAVRALFEPRSVALVGASTQSHKWGHFIARHLLAPEAAHKIWLINPTGGEIMGVATVPTLSALPEAPDVVIIVVPPTAAEAAVHEALDLGSRAFCIMTGGFGESSAEGLAAQDRIVEAINSHGGVLLGPNCVGYQDSGSQLFATRILYPEGPIGVVSQSGLVTHDLSRYAKEFDTGFSRALNLGNQADFQLSDALESFIGHAPTRAVIVYCEDMRSGRAVLSNATRLRASGRPVILLTVGASQAAARSALSHTGALVTEMVVMDTACRDAGIIRVHSTKEAIAIADCIARLGFTSKGKRVGILTDGGGMGSLAAERLSLAGLDVVELSADLQRQLKDVIGPRAGTGNPIDMAGEADYDVLRYARAVETMLGSDELDAVVVSAFFGGYAYGEQDTKTVQMEREAAMMMADACTRSGKPLIVHSVYSECATGQLLRERGVPVHRDLDTAVSAILAISADVRMRDIPLLPDPEAQSALPDGYWNLRALMMESGVPFPDGMITKNAEEAVSFAKRSGYPVVAKAIGLLHKSDSGGVKLNLKEAGMLRSAVNELMAAFPTSPISVERQAPVADGVELLVGAKVDPHLGPVVTVAMGGIFVELLSQSATALAPISEDDATDLILSLPGAAILQGVRGQPKLDVAAAAKILSKVSRFAAQYASQIEAVELNPVLVLPDRAIALDARVVLATDTLPEES